MEVLALTLFLSLLFAVLFLFLFVRERKQRGPGGVERDSLIPFDGDDDFSAPSGHQKDQ